MTRHTTMGLRTTQPLGIDNRANGIATCCYLTDLLRSDIITEVGCIPARGGCCDNDERIFDSQGGGNRTESLRGNGEAHVATWGIAGPQGKQYLAHQRRQVRGVEKSRAGYTGSGKLNSSSVARCELVKIGTPNQSAVGSRYLTAILHASRVSGKGGREVYPHE